MRNRALELVIALAALVGVLATGCGPSYQHVLARSVAAPGGLSCTAYVAWNHEPVRHVFVVINGSGTLSNAFVHPTFERLLKTQRVAYSTYDKPGIQAPFGDPANVRRDYSLFRRYTLGHGVSCATEALRSARAEFGPAVRLHLRGHSEGTLVALYAYDTLLEQDVETANAISTLVLSGLALEPFDLILEHQLTVLPDRDRLRAALASCDDALLGQRLGISCAYVEDAKRRPSGRTMFERLASRGARARFHVFHGTEDWNTKVEPVRALEGWNAADGRLALTFHYYAGGHAGSEAARSEVARLLESLVSTDPPTTKPSGDNP